MAKGSDFERWLSIALSGWWSNGERSDIFWRSTTSGARATTRRKGGKRTAGSAGDITAIDPIGNPLTDLVVIEAKNGYNRDSMHDLFDVSNKHGAQQFEKWYAKILDAQEINSTPYWVLIWKRTQRVPLIYMPNTLFRQLVDLGCQLHNATPQMRLVLKMESVSNKAIGVFGMLLEHFLEEVAPEDIITISKQ